MRYINLKKRNTSKFQYVAKRLATVSMLSFVLTAVIVVPLTSKEKTLQAAIENQEVEIVNENNTSDVLCKLEVNSAYDIER